MVKVFSGLSLFKLLYVAKEAWEQQLYSHVSPLHTNHLTSAGMEVDTKVHATGIAEHLQAQSPGFTLYLCSVLVLSLLFHTQIPC